jgi:amino acid transporter
MSASNPARVGWWRRVKRALFGAPIHSSRAHHERLGIFTGLPVFASDNLSSSAYANESILSVLVLYSATLAGLQLWLALSIAVLIGIVAWSYKQTIYAYPGGGGSYIVASDNLGELPGLIAGASLMIDYVLTVAVSVAAGVAAIVSAFPHLHEYLVPLSVACIAVIAYGNMRGVRESGAMFSLPTYGFLLAMLLLLVFGVLKAFGAPEVSQAIVAEPGAIGSEASFPLVFIILRSFAAGCTALTGIEAVSNGIPAFRAPEARNASRTLLIMAATLTVLFLGLGYITQHLPVIELFATKNPEYSTLVSQIASWTFGAASFGFYFVQFATAAILILAANTSFMDFPRLSSLLARDGYLPRPLARQGDRLVFQNGIVLLAIASAVLVWAYHGELDQLLPLYAVGVFLAFTLSQAGMVAHWRKLKEPGHGFSIAINSVGTLITGAVTLVLLVTKFAEGAWIIAVLTAAFYFGFVAIKRRYTSITGQLSSGLRPARSLEAHTVLVLVPRIHRGVVRAIEYALSLNGEARALHVALNPATVPDLTAKWERIGGGLPLVVLDSPYRSLIDPVLDYVDALREERPEETVTVIVCEAVPSKWYHRFLQENLAFQLKFALGGRRNVVVTNVRYFLE